MFEQLFNGESNCASRTGGRTNKGVFYYFFFLSRKEVNLQQRRGLRQSGKTPRRPHPRSWMSPSASSMRGAELLRGFVYSLLTERSDSAAQLHHLFRISSFIFNSYIDFPPAVFQKHSAHPRVSSTFPTHSVRKCKNSGRKLKREPTTAKRRAPFVPICGFLPSFAAFWRAERLWRQKSFRSI